MILRQPRTKHDPYSTLNRTPPIGQFGGTHSYRALPVSHYLPKQTGRKNGEIFTPVLHSAATSRDNGEDAANLRTSKRKRENVRLLLRVLPSWIF